MNNKTLHSKKVDRSLELLRKMQSELNILHYENIITSNTHDALCSSIKLITHHLEELPEIANEISSQ